MSRPRARRWPSLAGCLAIGALIVSSRMSGQTPPQPTAKDLVARHVTAIGGEAAYKAVKSMRVHGKFEIPAQGISADFETFAARPAKLRLHVDIPGIGSTEEGYDGHIGWTIDPQMGARLLVGRELTELADDAEFDSTLHLPGFVKDMTFVDRAEFDGRAAYKVRVQLQSGLEQIEYFDVERGVEIGSESTRTTPFGAIPTTSLLRDYTKFGAILQPATIVQRALSVEQILRVASIDYDVVTDTAFDLPPQIKALIK
jgi:hypothetical protein